MNLISWKISIFISDVIAWYNNLSYVGDNLQGTILVIENEVIINKFNGCNQNGFQLNFILFDYYVLMAISCNNSKLYLYCSNGTFLGKNITTPATPRYTGYDSSRRSNQCLQLISQPY